jgi:hypothetical protein
MKINAKRDFFAAWGMIPKSGGRFFGKIIHNKQSAP